MAIKSGWGYAVRSSKSFKLALTRKIDRVKKCERGEEEGRVGHSHSQQEQTWLQRGQRNYIPQPHMAPIARKAYRKNLILTLSPIYTAYDQIYAG